MTTTAPLVGYVASLRDEIRTARIAHAETSRLAIASRLHDILALVQPTDAIDHAIGALCDRCFDLLEVLKQCDSPGPDDVNAVTIVRSAALIAVDDLEQVLGSATPSAEAIACGLDWPTAHPQTPR
jgi:acyl-CoA synthetase (NDP forming)